MGKHDWELGQAAKRLLPWMFLAAGNCVTYEAKVNRLH
jgi:hypothetical protein